MISWTALALLTYVLGGHALDLMKATSGHPGGHKEPIPVPEVRCWCPSYPNLTICSWPEPSHAPPKGYVVTFSEKHNESIIKPFHLVQPGSPSAALGSSSPSERRWFCHLPNLKLLTDYVINVTAVHSDGSSSYLSSFMVEDILKPDPPVDLQVQVNAKTLLVRWSPPPTWVNMDIAPLKYHIRYQWTSRGTRKSVSLGPFEGTKADLKGLAPGRSYQFQVCAKELLDLGECSSWSSPANVIVPRN